MQLKQHWFLFLHLLWKLSFFSWEARLGTQKLGTILVSNDGDGKRKGKHESHCSSLSLSSACGISQLQRGLSSLKSISDNPWICSGLLVSPSPPPPHPSIHDNPSAREGRNSLCLVMCTLVLEFSWGNAAPLVLLNAERRTFRQLLQRIHIFLPRIEGGVSEGDLYFYSRNTRRKRG